MSSKTDEQILRAAKEIAVKFIEIGRISPTSFDESFTEIYKTIDSVVKNAITPESKGKSKS